MSLGRPGSYGTETRDPEADFRAAYEEEYKTYMAVGQIKQAEQVAEVLRKLNHPVPKMVVKERAVNESNLEKAVETTPKRRGRPPAKD